MSDTDIHTDADPVVDDGGGSAARGWWTRRRRLVAIGGAAVLLIGGGSAYAYWTSTGTGEGSVDTGAPVAFVVASTPGTGGPLTPGGPTETVAFTVTNPDTGVLTLQNVTVTVAQADGTPWTVTGTANGCSAADYTVGTPVFPTGDIAPGATVNGTVTVTMINRPVNQNDCQNVTVPLYFVAS